MKILTVEQMKAEERLSDEMGVTYQRLMENAGCAAAAFIRKTLSNVAGRNFMIFCGSGNNGGDGFVVARKLFEEKANVIVVLCGGMPRSDEAKYMYNCLIQAGTTMLDFDMDRRKVDTFLEGADIIIDALFGTGFAGEFRAPYDEIAEMINSALAVRISLDIPSGVSAETGVAAKGSVKANFTVAFEAAKPGHILLPGKEFCGKTEIVDIGIPHEVRAQIEQNCFAAGGDMVFSSIRKRPRFSNKGTYGKLLCITGSANFPGAAALSAMGALRAGAGITTVATTEKVVSMIVPRIPEATFLPLPENEDGTISAEAKEKLLPALEKADAVLMGCGLGRGKDIAELVEFVLENAGCTVVLDADGINCIAEKPEVLKKAKEIPIITPHMGEMARLRGISIAETVEKRIETASETAKKYGCIVVLKDATTVVAEPNGDIYFNTTGNPGLSKGGSGDCLAGIIASFAAQGFIETACAVCGVYLHGLAADRAAKELSEYGMLPSDIPTYLCRIFAEKGL
ncbi:MAG: NAD(P)H-hydrate dehydratase [Oscillospiraceae bacterium]|nr:NAD(P)H-hydrate dehydratase [Oscillospiraceae bacterium]